MNQQYEVNEMQQKKFYHPSNENDDSLWSTLLALKNIVINTPKSVSAFVNPWEKQDEKVHGPNRKKAQEVLFSTKKDRFKNRKTYVPAEMRRSGRY